MHCTLYLIAHLTPYFISLFVSYLILTIFVFIYTLSCFLFHSFLLLLCYFFYFIIMFYFSFLHFPLSGPVPTNISLPIIPCMIVYVTNNKEPWTLNPLKLFQEVPTFQVCSKRAFLPCAEYIYCKTGMIIIIIIIMIHKQTKCFYYIIYKNPQKWIH